MGIFLLSRKTKKINGKNCFQILEGIINKRVETTRRNASEKNKGHLLQKEVANP